MPMLLLIVLLLVSQEARSQNVPPDLLPRDGTAAHEYPTKQENSLPAFTAHAGTSKIQVETTAAPTASDAYSGRPIEEQIHFFDGSLQNYLNVNNPYLMGRMHNPILPFGGTAVLPVANGRVEIHGGAGELFVPYATVYTKPNSWLAQTSLGAGIAVDPGHHVWLGGTAYYLTDFADKTRQWGYGTADLTIRFGR
jgi:hypothetical protein